MVKITNIKIEEIDFKKENSAEFARCLKLMPNLRELLPRNIKYKVMFELHETNSDFANAIRRSILNESPVKSLDYDEYKDTNISDPYILSDFLKKQIELIPINQDIDYTKYSIELKLENQTDEIIDITTRDFVIKKDGKVVDINTVMSSCIIICRLRPLEHLHVKNIKIKEGIGRENAGAFSNVSNIYYKPLDTQPRDVIKGTGESSLISNPTKFLLGYSTHRNIAEPLQILKNACNALINRLSIIAEDINGIDNNDIHYYSDLIQMETNGAIKEFQFKNENWTIVNLIARYCYILTKGNIKFVAPAIIHPEKEIGVLRIIHPEFLNLVVDSIKKIINDLKKLS